MGSGEGLLQGAGMSHIDWMFRGYSPAGGGWKWRCNTCGIVVPEENIVAGAHDCATFHTWVERDPARVWSIDRAVGWG